MRENMSLVNSLIDVDDSILIVIDVQEYFLAKLPAEEREPWSTGSFSWPA